jgi:aspartate aminotransferase-like enzyme
MLSHRSKEFEAIFQRTSEKAKALFLTQYRVFIVAGSGTGLQEAAIRNFVRRNVLCCVNGAFAERWHDVAVSNGKQADKLAVEWDKPVTPELVSEALKKKHYEAVTIVHNETSTGLQNPVREVAEAIHAASPETLVFVDAVSSLGGARVEMDRWRLDMVLTSSQKAIALPRGWPRGCLSWAMQSRDCGKSRLVLTCWMERHRLKFPRRHPSHVAGLRPGLPARPHPGGGARGALRPSR